jgi:hypothetical protein
MNIIYVDSNLNSEEIRKIKSFFSKKLFIETIKVFNKDEYIKFSPLKEEIYENYKLDLINDYDANIKD